MNNAIVKKVIVGKEIVEGRKFTFEIGNFYLKHTIKVSKIEPKIIDGIHYTLIYVTKINDPTGPMYLWWALTANIMTQFNIDFNN